MGPTGVPRGSARFDYFFLLAANEWARDFSRIVVFLSVAIIIIAIIVIIVLVLDIYVILDYWLWWG